jgi:hypothetical protein
MKLSVRKEMERPDGEDLAIASVRFPTSAHSQPMTTVVDGVRGVDSGLKNDAGLDFAWELVVVLLFFIAEGIVGGVRGKPGRGRSSRRLELATSLPLGSTREP